MCALILLMSVLLQSESEFEFLGCFYIHTEVALITLNEKEVKVKVRSDGYDRGYAHVRP